MLKLYLLLFLVSIASAQELIEEHTETVDTIEQDVNSYSTTAEFDEKPPETIELLTNTTIFENGNTTDILENTTLTNETNSTPVARNSTRQNLAPCLPFNSTHTIEIVNASRLLKLVSTDPNITTKDTPGNCVAVLFYSQSCPYSCRLAKSYNALPEAFPNIKLVAIEAMTHHIFNAQNGIVGVPTMILFHNGRILGKLPTNDYKVELIIKFIMSHVDGGAKNFEEARRNCYVAEHGLQIPWHSYPLRVGPLPTEPVYQCDYCLGLSWLFIIVCGIYFFSKSKYYLWIVETVQNTWRESEAQAQHEHTE